jgi:hypothetical protein
LPAKTFLYRSAVIAASTLLNVNLALFHFGSYKTDSFVLESLARKENAPLAVSRTLHTLRDV